MNYDGLKDDIIRMLAGERAYVDTLNERPPKVFCLTFGVLTLLVNSSTNSINPNNLEIFVEGDVDAARQFNFVFFLLEINFAD